MLRGQEERKSSLSMKRQESDSYPTLKGADYTVLKERREKGGAHSKTGWLNKRGTFQEVRGEKKPLPIRHFFTNRIHFGRGGEGREKESFLQGALAASSSGMLQSPRGGEGKRNSRCGPKH